MNHLKYIILSFQLLFILSSCEIEGLENDNLVREDFSYNNYILATEDASNSDITRFFNFEISEVVGNDKPYDLLSESSLFTNSDPSTSAGHYSIGHFFFALTKDKKGKSSTPGIYRMTLDQGNRVFIDQSLNLRMNNLFPSRKLSIVNKNLGFMYNEGVDPYSIFRFDPYLMTLGERIELEESILNYRPNTKWLDESGNNLVRTGSNSLDEKEGKLYVSVTFLETVSFNIIPDSVTEYHLAVVDINSNEVEKFISYPDTRTVGFFVSENNPTTKDEEGNLYFCSWGWNQYGTPTPSKVFRIKAGKTDFDNSWEFNVETHFGEGRIAQSIISYNNKIYLHISKDEYGFADDETGYSSKIEMEYYELDPRDMSVRKLDIPISNPSSRMSVFSIIDDKLYICVPNSNAPKFNGIYSINRNGQLQEEISLENKYRPVRLYKLVD